MHGCDWHGERLDGWFVSEKSNGWRAVWTGRALLTRQGRAYAAPAWFVRALPTDTPLDCELWLGRRFDNDDVNAAVRSGQWQDLRLAVFDVPEVGLTIEDALARIEALALPAHAQSLDFHRAESTEAAWEFARAIVASGGEGAVARRPGTYYFPTRSCNVLKLKPAPNTPP